MMIMFIDYLEQARTGLNGHMACRKESMWRTESEGVTILIFPFYGGGNKGFLDAGITSVHGHTQLFTRVLGMGLRGKHFNG